MKDFTIFFPGNDSVCLLNLAHEANFFVIKYLCVLHSTIYASHGIGESVQWIMDIVEKCVRGFIFLIVSKPKDNWQFEGKYSNYCDNVFTLHFDLGFSYIFQIITQFNM